MRAPRHVRLAATLALLGGACAPMPPVPADGASPDAPADSTVVAPPDARAPDDAVSAVDVPAMTDADARDAAPMCPAGVGSAWRCDATRGARERCASGALAERERCEFGCNPPADGGAGASCSCGPNTGFTLWNCTADGDLHRCTGGAYETRSCEGRGCRAQPVGVDDICAPPPGTAPLQPVLDRLGALCPTISPGTRCGLAVHDLATDEVAQYDGARWFVSASSVKAVWVAAALRDTSVAAVMPYAEPIFARSDNYASGSVIDLLASPARVNTFMWDVAGMPDSGFCSWSYGRTRRASNCPSTAGGNNFFTARDAVAFLARLQRGALLSREATDAELRWMLLAPRSGYGGWLGTQLPATARATMRHKAGWLPPSEVPGYSNSNEIGLVEYAPGRTYAVATLMNGGTQYNTRQLPLMEYASCVIFHAVARDVADPFGAPCRRP